DGLNPFTCRARENAEICSMIYESLFTVNEDFSVSPLLCRSWETEDGSAWSFTLEPGIKTQDGETLTAQDAVYSIQRAKTTKWSSRFKNLASAEATGELTFTVRLSEPNTSFISLLDTPIVRSSVTWENGLPIGTGPYIFENSGEEPTLRAFAGHRNYDTLPAETVYLADLPQRELSRAFVLRDIDLVYEDPLSAGVEINVGHELNRVHTSVLQYAAFNLHSPVFEDAAVRRAVALAVDRKYMTETIMEGAGIAAPLIFSPAHHLYSPTWESEKETGARAVSLALSGMGFRDADADGFIERPGEDGQYLDFSVTIAVNSDNSFKTAAAEEIARVLKSVGAEVTVKALPYEEYETAIISGAFDMYIAETRLGCDFDFTSLLGTDGSLNFGHYSNEKADGAISGFLSAEDDEKRETEARLLCSIVDFDAPVVPILYRDYYVHTWRGAVRGMSPSVSGIFRDIGSWTIK
ncbi:MAG: hypothetical protein IKR21_04995, partial [Oscillospiraceae bacterium]|nr:hypothetical protein [Oscillospiraceae bacterium]